MAAVLDPRSRRVPQVLKEEVRHRILDAALDVFAEHGFAGATMQLVGERANASAASLYRYYPSKEALFRAAVPAIVAESFDELLQRRVTALAAADDGASDPTGEEMLRFWVAHRREVVILLDRAAGTEHEAFAKRFVDALVELTSARIQATHRTRLGPGERFVLRRIFESTRSTLAAILERHPRERDLRAAIAAFWSYQIAGLRGFRDHVGR